MKKLLNLLHISGKRVFTLALLVIISSNLLAQSPWAVMTTDKEGASGKNSWATTKSFSKDFSQEYFNEGYRITYINWTGIWFVGFEKQSYGQFWRASAEFPADFIGKYWDMGYSITDLTYGKARWLVVMSNLKNGYMQAYATEKNYPKTKKKVQSYRKDGYYITSLQHLPRLGSFAMVFTEDPNVLDQEIMATKSRKFPKKQIQKYWDDGFTITELTYVEGMSGSGYWVIVASELKQKVTQSWVTSFDGFPEDWVDKQWDKNRVITNAQLWNY